MTKTFSTMMDAFAATFHETRQIVKDAKARGGGYTASGLRLEPGEREETDEEFRERLARRATEQRATEQRASRR